MHLIFPFPTALEVLYATDNKIYLLQLGLEELVWQCKLVHAWPKDEDVYLQDMDWRRGLVYWTDSQGRLLRFHIKTRTDLMIPTNSPGDHVLHWAGATVQLTKHKFSPGSQSIHLLKDMRKEFGL